ncbi:unnamed protein product [Linum tenue]|uniref:Uncharacterized protein n=1 Tax=Linum tenue TaxID=586396 RepID=A0AAV0S4I4_9ROSI|nr:unnamed protein product [Linum tenue]
MPMSNYTLTTGIYSSSTKISVHMMMMNRRPKTGSAVTHVPKSKQQKSKECHTISNHRGGAFLPCVSISTWGCSVVASGAEYGIRLDPVLNSELAGDSSYRSGCLQHLY